MATGSIYLIAELVSRAGHAEGVRAVNDRGPSVLGMIALVAVVVALTILVFFALGYAFGPDVLLGDRRRAVRFDYAHDSPSRVFGINNDALNTAVNVLILVLIVVWAALVFWTFADARRRIDDPMLVGCATLASLFPFVGTIVYAIVRPPEYLDDVRLRELEMQAAEARLVQLDYQLCPHCEYEVKATSCAARAACASSRTAAKLRQGRSIPAWRLCPYCEAETGAAPPRLAQPPAPARRRRRPRRPRPSRRPRTRR